MTSESQERKERFGTFLEWFNKHIKGDEKSEGQIFLEYLIKAFGNEGIKQVGAECEERVKKTSGRTGFADLVWKPRVIIELKKRGENLAKHYPQAQEYWWNLVPNRPKYMVLCNFDEFWIYDFEIQVNDPVHILSIQDLPNDWGGLAFLFPKQENPVFNNNNVEVTESAAKILGSMYLSLLDRKVKAQRAQRFVLQLVVALFAEDVDLIPKYTLYKILQKSVKDPVSQSELYDLFTAMATKPASSKPKNYKKIPYFNGGLFNDVDPIELSFSELDLLYEASKHDWSKVRPSIFGSIFEASTDPDTRHEQGMHYTHEIDIQKIIEPTISKPFRDKIAKARSKKKIGEILEEIQNFKVLDPACGSGNFLYLAYRELVRLEVEALSKFGANFDENQIRMSMISPKNFYGIDTNNFGIELAKIALCIGRKIAADEYKLSDQVLPFEDLDDNFTDKDALFIDWPEADAIVGNPPFLGGKYLREERGDEYAESVYKKFPYAKGQPDFCVFWFKLAQDSKAKRVGLVGTNSVAQGVSRKASLDYVISKGGVITNAVSTQEWSGDANVHVSIVNWVKEKKLIPEKKLLDFNKASTINSSLKDEVSYTDAHRLKENKGFSFEGCQLAGKGFVVTKDEAKSWIKTNPKNREVLKVMLDGQTLVNPGKEKDWVIDFNNMSLEEASTYKEPFNHVKETVKPIRDGNNRKARRENWWKFGERRPGMRSALDGKKCYFCLPKIAKYTCFQAIDISVLPCEANMVVASDDYFILGVLNSKVHLDWVLAQRSTLEDRTRYTNTTCFETFPFPLQVNKKSREQIVKVMTELEEFRKTECISRDCSITAFYNDFFNEPSSKLFKLHEKLNQEVVKSYGWKFVKDKTYNPEIFKLNKERYEEEGS